ncbi:6-cysteine protein [Plasmodium sp. gorilla clade G2]|uniref:6-cysteine protein n=1 Tax=Plasmodium sp. gorilla clade G2 TaxID=880535 RepID=UPI000D21D792|nr:6-cysteine protein [Plasmodium sp. gorilla clade G2]SOV18197.1 6-cysteine protein [Plasmodium sp. gorilla clade G2]
MMLYIYAKKAPISFILYIVLLLKIISGNDDFRKPSSLNSEISGFIGYKCNFSNEGVHNLKPDTRERRSIFCNIHSYFIYDKIRLIIPKKSTSPEFKLLPENCFKKVYTDYENRVETDISELGLIEYEVEENDTNPNYNERTITISPFSKKDIEFFCFCDNTEKVISSIEGRSAMVHVRVLKYPHNILFTNLTNDVFTYLPKTYNESNFVSNALEVELNDGELFVLACELINKKCFQEPKEKALYKSNKIIYHKNLTIFKAPSYVTSKDVNTECTCKFKNNQYKIVLKPKYEKKVIHGCNFSSNVSSKHSFTDSLDISLVDDNAHISCNVHLSAPKYNHLVGLNCPGDIIPDCFFQVYQPESEELEPSNIVYLDSHINIGDIEYYEDAEGDDKIKIFGIVGSIPKTTSFTCICKKDKKSAYMTVTMDSAYYGFLAKTFIFLIVAILLYI